MKPRNTSLYSALTLMIITISIVILPFSVSAATDYNKVRVNIQEPCYPLCNLQKYSIQKKYYPQENPFYYAQINDPQHNPYYYGDLYNRPSYTNESGYYTNNNSNTTPFDKNYRYQINTQNDNQNYVTYTDTSSNYQPNPIDKTHYTTNPSTTDQLNNQNTNNPNNINQPNNQDNNSRYYQSSNNGLAKSGGEIYIMIGLVLIITSIVTLFIRKKRRLLKSLTI